MDRRGTAAIARQARKSARRDVSTSGKRFDAACRAIAAALRVAHGTDRPYDMSEADPVGFIGSAEGLTDTEKHDILGATTARLLDLN